MTTLEVCDNCNAPITRIYIQVTYFGIKKTINHYCDEECLAEYYEEY